MAQTATIRRGFVSTVSYLYVFLFAYAATSKWLDFQNFKIQLGQSPLLSAAADWISIAVPLVEYVIALLLLLPRFRLAGLYAALVLMALFTGYIFFILNYASFVPCSCGGILESMGWQEHLWLNILFLLLAVFAVFWYLGRSKNPGGVNRLKLAGGLSGLIIGSFLFIGVLFLYSERKLHQNNPFIRVFPAHSQTAFAHQDLGYDSFYFAGADQQSLYLGNATAPLLVTQLDNNLAKLKRFEIKPDTMGLPYQGVRLQVVPPEFMVFDGIVPCIYTGTISDWKAVLYRKPLKRFKSLVPADGQNGVITYVSQKTKSSELGAFNLELQNPLSYNDTLLQDQGSGYFDTDGRLLYDKWQRRFVYLYYYRNQYVVFGSRLKKLADGRTIDNTVNANIQSGTLSDGSVTLSAPPLMINKAASVYKNLLFVHSDRLGKYDRAGKFEKNAIIDIYNLDNGNYLLSIYIPNFKGIQMKDFKVNDGFLYALGGHYISATRLPPQATKHYRDHPAVP